MSTSKFASPKLIAVAVVGLLGIGGAVWGLVGAKRADANPSVAVPKEFTVDALKNAPPEQSFENFRKAMDREDLTEEQREQIRENGREARERMMDERANEYFACKGKEERQKLLDKQIDEMEKMIEKMRKEREAREAERDQQSDKDKEKEKDRWKNMRQKMDSMSQGERKSRSESRSPDKQAKLMTYRQAMDARMQERGIERPKFGGPGGGGPRGGGERPPKP